MLRLIFLSFLLLTPILAQADIEESRRALEELASKVKFFQLDNGIRVILHRRGEAPVFSGVVSVRVGGVDEQAGDTGISHMLEHMAFKGTTSIGTTNYKREKVLLDRLEELMAKSDAGQNLQMLDAQDSAELATINKELEELWKAPDFTAEYTRRGASDLNATTGKELTQYFVSLPSNYFELWCWMESERLFNPVLRQFYQERGVVLEERRMRYEDDPQGKLYEQLLGTVYLIHPYRNPVIGYEHDVRGLTESKTEAFRKRYYVPSNIALSVVGNVDLDFASRTINKYFGRIPAGQAPAHPQIEEPAQSGERSLVVEKDTSPELYIAYRKVQYPHPDDAAISVMSEILAGSSLSPMYTELVKKKQIASSVDSFEAPGNGYPNLLIFSVVPKNPYGNLTVLEAFDQVLAAFKNRSVTDEELLIAKRAVAVEYLGHLKSNLSLATDFTSSELLYNNWKSFLDWYDQIMAVQAKDVARVADSYLVANSRTVARIETKRGKR